MRTLLSQPPTSRVGRYPKHTFNVHQKPWVIQPFLLARVLPGETLTNLYFEARAVLRGVPSPIIGWKLQHFYFYVRATDLMLDEFKAMFVDPTNTGLISSTALEDATGNAPTYCAPGGIDWTLLAVQKITEHWFRDDGQAWDFSTDTTTGLPIAQIRENSWMDSIVKASDMPEGDAISGATDAGDLDRLMDAFEALRAMGIANMSYEDWLRSQGIAVPEKDEGKPELLHTVSEFTYPVNTIDPTTGTPSSALSFVLKGSERKPKFCKEPGFIVGVSLLRPKVYFGGLAGSLAGFADRAWDWMPNYLRQMPETSFKEFAADTGPIPDPGTASREAYFVDMRDELVHGDQFVYQMEDWFVDPLAFDGEHHKIARPGDNYADWKYPPPADTWTATPLATDGFVSLNIKGFEVDYTVGNFAEQ